MVVTFGGVDSKMVCVGGMHCLVCDEDGMTGLCQALNSFDLSARWATSPFKRVVWTP